MNDSLDERLRRANEDYRLLLKWAIEETNKVRTHLEQEGTLLGLDTNREAYAPIHEEYKKRLLAIFDKYSLPNKPKL